MMNYLEPIEDELLMRDSGRWAQVKLDYVRRYIDVFEKSMRDKWHTRHFIDLFAGPGKCRDRDSGAIYLGSPLIALNTQFPFTDYFFVDADPENMSALERRCAVSRKKNSIRCLTDDSNNAVKSIVAEINQSDKRNKSSSLNLAFLDPEGLELHWNTIATLASIRKMDLIIHYPVMGLKRMLEVAARRDEHTFDLFFGDKDWRKIYEKKKDASIVEQDLLVYYKRKLEKLGYVEVIQEDPTITDPAIKNTKQGLLYRLLFASKNPLGDKFWKEVTKRDVHGQTRFPGF